MNYIGKKERVYLAWYFRVWAAENVHKAHDQETKAEALDRWTRLFLTCDLDGHLVERFNRWLVRNSVSRRPRASLPLPKDPGLVADLKRLFT